MARSDIVSYGAGLKQAVANVYTCNGPAFGRRLAKEYLAQIGAAVSEIDGPEMAANMMFRATDAVLARVPVSEIGTDTIPDKRAAAEPSWAEIGKRVNVKMRLTEKIGWVLVGLLLSKPVFDMLHAVTGW